MKRLFALCALSLGVLVPLFAQSTPVLPWPAQSFWHKGIDLADMASTALLTHSKAVLIQADLPASFASPPTWFTQIFTVVSNPKDADLYIFLRPGNGGNVDPDILIMTPDGKRVTFSITELPHDPSHVLVLSSEDGPVRGTNWDWIRSYFNGQKIKEAQEDARAEKERAKQAKAAKQN